MAIPPHVTGDRALLEEISRLQAHAVSLTDRTILCRVLGKYLMFADADDFSVTPHVALNGYWESWTTLALARTLPPSVHAVDVGANHGYFTLLMADAAGSDGRVVAIEPNPRLAELLARTIEVNGFAASTSVLARAAAASSGPVADLIIPCHHSADASVIRHATPLDQIVTVDTISIDDAAADWPRVDFVKVDAEGAEETIWTGMTCTLRRNRSIIVVMEFKPACYDDPRRFLARIAADGFPLRRIGDDGAIEEITESEALRGGPGGDWMLFLQRESL